MGVLKIKTVKELVKSKEKQITKEALIALESKIHKQILVIIENCKKKRMKVGDIY